MYRVLIVPSFYPTAEAPLVGTFFREHAEMLQRAGLQAEVACVQVRSLRQFGRRSLHATHFQSTLQVERGVKVARLHGWNPLAQTLPGGLLWARLAAEFAVRHARREGRPDLIHAQNALWGGEAARIASARLSVPFVVTEHASAVLSGALGWREAFYARRVWKTARAVCAVSGAQADAIAAHGIRRPLVVGNSIDTNFFSLPPKDYLAPERGRLLVVANLVRVKRVDHLLRALRLAFADGVSLHLDVVGGGAEYRRLLDLTKALGLEGRVRFLGALERTRVREAMWRAACLVSSSERETFGMAVAEALATGLPVVATRSGGVDEILAGGVGRLVDSDRPERLAEALRVTDPIDRLSRIRRREHIVRLYSEDVIAAEYLSLYRAVLNRSSCGAPHDAIGERN